VYRCAIAPRVVPFKQASTLPACVVPDADAVGGEREALVRVYTRKYLALPCARARASERASRRARVTASFRAARHKAADSSHVLLSLSSLAILLFSWSLPSPSPSSLSLSLSSSLFPALLVFFAGRFYAPPVRAVVVIVVNPPPSPARVHPPTGVHVYIHTFNNPAVS